MTGQTLPLQETESERGVVSYRSAAATISPPGR